MDEELKQVRKTLEQDLSLRLKEKKESMSAKSWNNYVDNKFNALKPIYVGIIEQAEKVVKEEIENPEPSE